MSFVYEKKNELWRLFTYQFINPDLRTFLVTVSYQVLICCPFEVIFGSKVSVLLQTFGVLMGKNRQKQVRKFVKNFLGGLIFGLQAESGNILMGNFGGNFAIAIPCIFLVLKALYTKDQIGLNLLRLVLHIAWMSESSFCYLRDYKRHSFLIIYERVFKAVLLL